MGCIESTFDPEDKEPGHDRATKEVATPTSDEQAGTHKPPSFENVPSEPIDSPQASTTTTPDAVSKAYSPKLQGVAAMIDTHAAIPESESVEDLMIDANAVGMDMQTINEDEEHEHKTTAQDDDDEDEDDEDYTEDKFNKDMTMYEITDEMSSNLEQLIADKVAEIERKTKFVIVQSSASTKAGLKDGQSKTNQDSSFMHDRLGPQGVLQFYGVCDGHGPSGHNVSQYCCEHLSQLLIKDNERILTTLCKPAYALMIAIEELDEKLDAEKKSGQLKFDMSASGTTLTCGLRVGNHLYLANLGDSRAVMGHYDANNKTRVRVQSKQLTVDHDPTNQMEADRISKSTRGKLVDGNARIHINLIDDKFAKPRQSVLELKQTYGVDALKQLNAVSASVSRSIGDKVAHKYGGVISKPDIIIHRLCDNDLFCMWASDGIWTVIDNGDVTRIIGNKLKTCTEQKSYADLQKLTDKVVKEAHIVWQDEFDDYVDDITAVVVRIASKQLAHSQE
eukprot:CAMPEP_0197024338 /NCGR_PEP_ID=MMETSP1384-20130603/4894_1 /TAXON_ID=29189 /ORGANISM="Ammonia sp." /LENGTH=505 /DNA_ID=CAMNT_0042452703 /DNA_START=18 /DNA_END=1535 /DNA_ORIENTATION=+